MKTYTLDPNARDLAPDVIASDGSLRVMPASYYASTTQGERSLLAHRHALYALPTVECIRWLSERIGTRSAIEVACGNGALGRALGIVRTDIRLQERADIQAVYRGTGTQTIRYGDDVETLDAIEAIKKYRPQVVIAAWFTHKFDPLQPERGGNMYASDERELLSLCEEYVLVGNFSSHGPHPLLQQPHELFQFPWLFSRSPEADRNFIACWRSNGR